MNLSIRRMQAIFMKDYKEFTRNYAISIMLLAPIIFAAMFEKELIIVVLNLTFGMLTAFVQATLIAEEKERNTLRSLTLTPASPLDILIGKSSLVFVMTAFIIAVVAFVMDFVPDAPMTIALILMTILFIALGTICGLYAKSVMEATLTVLPVLFIFSLGSMLSSFADRFPFLKVADYLPSAQLLLLDLGEKGAPAVIMNISIWTIIACIAAYLLYVKRLKDE